MEGGRENRGNGSVVLTKRAIDDIISTFTELLLPFLVALFEMKQNLYGLIIKKKKSSDWLIIKIIVNCSLNLV